MTAETSWRSDVRHIGCGACAVGARDPAQPASAAARPHGGTRAVDGEPLHRLLTDSGETVDFDFHRAHLCPAVAFAVTIKTSSVSSTASIVIEVSSVIARPSRAATWLPPTNIAPVAGTR